MRSPVGWFATGLIYDADKARQRLGGPPARGALSSRRRKSANSPTAASCCPTTATHLFIAAWRLLGVDPTRATALDVKSAGALLARTRLAVARLPGAPT